MPLWKHSVFWPHKSQTTIAFSSETFPMSPLSEVFAAFGVPPEAANQSSSARNPNPPSAGVDAEDKHQDQRQQEGDNECQGQNWNIQKKCTKAAKYQDSKKNS
jgi:hypothetical protein